MTAQKAKDLLLKLHNGSGFETVAGLRTKTLSFNAETVDITDSESAGRWRELLGGAGIQRASMTASGIFKDAASDETVRAAFFAGALVSAEIIIPGFGTIAGPFQFTSLEYSGQHNGELQFQIAMESGGALSFGGSA
ncbi:phage major tail protein, TP901-1 family [Martelella radicis]|uniref:TP901-1 family phage major tail protein n=1 Tax=Martelella radicis TaxID=1397476 RepID=A0A7W6KI74_9HYPH|nr:phage major tail protein, TP901-1 family [Martelella radicis]MBB4121592.1 TP901-1 family phage major tail protein [Martelella radicis]